ncbi:MAG: hypothetical protein HQL31_12850, partial [Planctomycetes bacterium]|nr:hypothetical protein [Planctomycetota bacterium]
DFASAVAVADDGSLYLTGTFQGNVDFDFGPGTFELETDDESKTAVFVSKYGPDRSFLWALAFAASVPAEDASDLGLGIATDSQNNVYICGMIGNTVDFTGLGSTSDYYGGSDCFLVKLDSTGVCQWSKVWGGSGNDRANAVAVGDNVVFVTGSYEG